MATQRVVLALTEEAAQVIDGNATERKRGEFVSQVLVQYQEDRESAEKGLLERIEARLARIEAILLKKSDL